MAYADYRLCDLCEEKAFYDANLNYESGREVEPGRYVRDTFYAIDRLGDWKVLCRDCAKTHKCVIVPVEVE